MAGCYRFEKDAKLPMFDLLTRDTAPELRFIHDRMPAILGREVQEAWLSDSADITGILQSSIQDLTQAV